MHIKEFIFKAYAASFAFPRRNAGAESGELSSYVDFTKLSKDERLIKEKHKLWVEEYQGDINAR